MLDKELWTFIIGKVVLLLNALPKRRKFNSSKCLHSIWEYKEDINFIECTKCKKEARLNT